MDALDHYRAHARYNTWMNRRLYALCAERLDDAQRREDRGAFFGSIHRTLNHILLGDSVWLGRFTGDPERFALRDANGAVIPLRALDQELYADFGELRAQREAVDAQIETWIGELSLDRLDATIEYARGRGGTQRHPLWWGLSHFLNHQTHHRGQVTTLLSQLGVDPGVTDMIAMLREEASER